MFPRVFGEDHFFARYVSVDDHLRIESSKSYTSKATRG